MEPVYIYIYTVRSLRSFTKAAEHLHISQPALSMAIKKFEDEINQPIFNRDTKPITLTIAGEIICAHIEELFLLEANTKAALDSVSDINSGQIILGGTQYIIAFVLPELIFNFTRKYPNVQIVLIESSSDKLPDLLYNNRIDLTLSLKKFDLDIFSLYKGITDHLFFALPKDFVTSPTLKEYCFTREEVLSSDYNDLESIPSLKELADIPFVLLREGNNLHDRILEIFSLEGISPPIKMYLDQLTTAHHICKNGFAATLTTDILINKLGDNDNLFYLKYTHPLMIRDFKVIIKTKRYMSNVLSEFINMFN